MRRVEKEFHKPPPELKACAQKYKNIFRDGNEDEALKTDCYRKARKALEELYHGKCAYCEIYIEAVSYTRIDHYRPKSIYKWLAVEWSNLVLSCERCNTKKGNEFPLHREKSRVTKGEPESEESHANSKILLDENPLLLHPELDDPRRHLEFETDGKIKKKNDSARGEKTIKVCDLDRDILRRERKLQIDGILYWVQKVTVRVISFLEEIPELCHNDKAILHLLSFYYEIFDELRKLQDPENDHAFTLLGLYMYEEFEYFIIGGLPDKRDTRAIVRKAFRLFKEGKLQACDG